MYLCVRSKMTFFQKKNDEVGFYEGVARFTSKKLNICTSTHVKPSVQAQHPKFLFIFYFLVIFFVLSSIFRALLCTCKDEVCHL